MRETLRWPVPAIFAVVAGTSILAAELTNYNLSGNGQQVLSTLASIQAAVFAIVFSVVILGIQLSTSRYSTRLADLFRTDRAYKKTVGIFAASLAADIIGLLAFTHVSPFTLRLLTSVALGLAAASFAVLYFFVDRTLEQTTPEGIIKRVQQDLTPNQIISDAEAADTDSSETDPFLVPVSIVRSAIDDRDVPAATQGLDVIDNQVEELLKQISTDQVEEDTPLGISLEELSTNRLPSAGEKTVNEDLGEAGSETVDTISSIGSNAIEQSHEPVATHTSQGLGKLVSNVDFETTGENVRKDAVDESGKMLQEAAEAELWDTAGTGTRILGWRAAQSVVSRGPTERFGRPYISLSLKYIPNILEKVVEGDPDNIDEEKIVVGLTVRNGEHAAPPGEWALWSCYAAMAEITSSFIRYEIQHDEEIVDWMSVGSGWTKCISTLNESKFDQVLRYWLGTLLYLDYIESELDNQYLESFRPTARYDVPEDVLDQTFEEILNGDFDPTSRIDLLPGRVNPVEFPRTGHPRPPVSDPSRSFKEWCKIQKGIGRVRGGWGADVIEKIDEEKDISQDSEDNNDTDPK